MNRGDESKLFEQVCDAIKHSPYSVEQIAEGAHTSSGLLYAWLAGRVKSPRITTLERVADVLDYSIVLKRGAAVLVKTLPEARAPAPVSKKNDWREWLRVNG